MRSYFEFIRSQRANYIGFLIFFLVFQSSQVQSFDDELKVFGFQTDGIPSNKTWALLLDPFPKLNEVTYCYRVKLLYFRTETSLFTYQELHNEQRIGLYHRWFVLRAFRVQKHFFIKILQILRNVFFELPSLDEALLVIEHCL